MYGIKADVLGGRDEFGALSSGEGRAFRPCRFPVILGLSSLQRSRIACFWISELALLPETADLICT